MNTALEVAATTGAICFIVALCIPGVILLGMLAAELWDDFR